MIRKPLKTGEKFGRLEVLARAPDRMTSRGKSAYRVRCRCECGNETVVDARRVRLGLTRSCGCLQVEAVKRASAVAATHGLSRSATYRVWSSMVSRCRSPTNPAFKRYGGTGIGVCDRWLSFENFFADMGERPSGRTIDRIDGTKGYAPDNCRWATPKEQSSNIRSNVFVVVAGDRLCVSEAARRLGIPRSTILHRVARHGATPQEAFDHFQAFGYQRRRRAPRMPTPAE